MADETLLAGNPEATGEGQSQGTPAADGAPAAGATEQHSTSEQTVDAGTTDAPAKPNDSPSTLGAPEAYEFKAPEGGRLDEQVLGELSSVAKDLDLSQGAAQQLVDRLAPKIAERQAAEQQRVLTEARTEWVSLAKADTEFGGEKFDQNLAVAKKALDAFGTPQLRELLKSSGLGDHPELIRAFYRAGKQISQDGFVPGQTRPAAAGRDAATTLYGPR